MRSKRLVSLMMALIVALTLFAPTLAWAAEGDGGDEIPTESTSAVSESEETAPSEETQPVETDPEPVADPESVAQITGAGEDMILISFTFNDEEVYSVEIAPGTSLLDSVFSAAEDVVRSYGVQDGKHIVWYLQQDQDNVFDRSAPLYASDTLIARWVADASGEEQTLSVTFNANGGYFQEDQTKTIWVSEFLVGDRFSPRALADEGILHNANTSLVFDGWYLDADGTEPIPLNGEGLFQPTESITVYAKWILNTVTFTVYANNDNSTPYQEESDEYSAGTTIGIWGCPFTYAGHSFTGWNTEPDGTGTAYMVNEQVTLEGDLTLYAQWEEEQITSGTCGDDLTWSFDPTTGILTVSGTGAMYAYDEVNSPAWMAFRMLIESVVLSNDITSVGTYAFYNCGNLTSACLPCSASIRTGAFQGTNLVSLHLTPGTGEMQYMQIEMISLNCKETLENLILDQGIKNIASCAFKDCAKLKTVVLPEGLESIDGSNAFSGALESITIPDSLMTIGSRAFWVCSSLRDVYYSGTQQLRDQIISIGSENDYLLNATWHYYEAESISVTTPPTKLSYWVGEPLDVSGGELTVDYGIRNGTAYVEQTALTVDMVSGFDSTVIGTQTLTVTYEGKTTTFEVEVVAKTLDHIAVTTLPTKTEYLEGKDALDVTGGKLTLYYNNDTADEIDLTADMVAGFNNKSIGWQTLTVTYEGKTTTFEVEIISKTLDHIAVTTMPVKTEYLEGKDELDVTGGRVTLYYNNDTADEIDLTADMVSGFDNTVVGTKTLTVTYEGKTATFEVEIQPRTYIVTLDANGGSCPQPNITVTYKKTYGTLPVPTRNDFTFMGWWTTKDSGGKQVTATTVCYASGNYTLYARWAKSFTVILNPNGGACDTANMTVTYGKAYGTLPTPTKTGYSFAGWWTQMSEGGVQIVSSDVCQATENFTLYARWTPKTYTVTLNPNGGSVSPTTKTVTYGQAYGALPTPTRSGYIFDGWWTTKDSGGKQVKADTVCYATGNYTLCARWSQGVTVSFNPNGGTCSTGSKTVTYGQAYGTLPVPKRLGYTFAGWWTVKDAGGKKVTASTICYATGNYTLYARWTEGYTMTFDPNGGTVSPTTKVVQYGQPYGTLPTPTKAGYTFTGWWTTKAEGGKQVTSTTVCYASAGYTLYARWTAKKFVITLNPNGGECATATKTVTYGQAYGTMPVPSPRTGYTFSGWWTAKTGGKKVTATTICYATGNYTLYARWTPKTYTVTLNPNGGTCTAGSKTVTYGQEYGTLPVPTRDGYVFAGWWTKKDSGGTQVFSSTTCYATGSYTLYARWKKN